MSVYAPVQPIPRAGAEFEQQQALLAKLEQRLDDGYARIELGIARGVNVEHWEEFWLELLHQYERLVDEFAASRQILAAAA
ncbi:MAG TPA: hypothetical protein VFQ54_05220 [Thermomicrobiales bacterium]|nr:hypothetical protein [Thermomicrobiales bacterium]